MPNIFKTGGGGSAKFEGNATVDQVLSGATFHSDDKEIKTGTMANNGAVSHSLSANGTYTIPKGYHDGNGKVTQSLTTKGATTYTPTTSNQTITSGTYLTGTQTIKGDSNLVSANILNGKSIFGVSGTGSAFAHIKKRFVVTPTLTLTSSATSSDTVTFETSINASNSIIVFRQPYDEYSTNYVWNVSYSYTLSSTSLKLTGKVNTSNFGSKTLTIPIEIIEFQNVRNIQKLTLNNETPSVETIGSLVYGYKTISTISNIDKTLVFGYVAMGCQSRSSHGAIPLLLSNDLSKLYIAPPNGVGTTSYYLMNGIVSIVEFN